MGVVLCFGVGLNREEGVREALPLALTGAEVPFNGLRGELTADDDVDGTRGETRPLTGADFVTRVEGVGLDTGTDAGTLDPSETGTGCGDNGGFTLDTPGLFETGLTGDVADLITGPGPAPEIFPAGGVTVGLGNINAGVAFTGVFTGAFTGLLVGGGGRALAGVTFGVTLGAGTFPGVGVGLLIAEGVSTAFFPGPGEDDPLGEVGAVAAVAVRAVVTLWDEVAEAEEGRIGVFFTALGDNNVESTGRVADQVPSPSSSFPLRVFLLPILGENVAPPISLIALCSSQAFKSSLCFPAAAISLSTTASADALQ